MHPQQVALKEILKVILKLGSKERKKPKYLMVAVELAFASSLAKWQHEKIALHEKIKAKKSL